MDNEVDNMKNIASQLRCPSGEAGLDMAEQMNQTNHGMTMSTTHQLNLKANDQVLEIGHGNAKHVAELFKIAPSINYSGLDISADMQKEAERLNADLIERNKARFLLYSGVSFPFEDTSFDKIMTVNTLYFWENPSAIFNEIYRVLKPGGVCNITYSHKDFMQNLPFTAYGFKLYNDEDVLALINNSRFKEHHIFPQIETVRSKYGEMVDRPYSIMKLKK